MAAAAVAACLGLAGPPTAAPAWPECPVHGRPITQLSLATKLDTPASASSRCSSIVAHFGAILAEHNLKLGLGANLEPRLQRYKRQVRLDSADLGHLACQLGPGASQFARPKHGSDPTSSFQWSPIPSAKCPQGRCKSSLTLYLVESLTRLTLQLIDTTLSLVSTLVL